MAEIRCRRCGDPVPRNADRCPKCGAPPPVDETRASVASRTRFQVGDVIDSRYEVATVLPTGGMGELYKVRHIHLGDFRVVKIRKATAREDDTGTKRFIREAKLAASIVHPNLASLFDFAQLDDGSFYMVNEYVDGMTVAEHIRAGGRFEIAQVLRIAEQALLALEAIHAAGIVHRDVASDNVMLAQNSSGETIVKLIDLGIAKTLDGEGLTSTGFFVGKARYASPEQVNTQDPEPIDQRSDLYSLGIVLYEMVSGDVPFAGATPAASVIKRLTSDITQVPPRDASIVIDTNVEGIILRLLRREREERFSSATDALREVRRQIAARPNYDSEGTLSRITRDRELYRLAGAPEPPKREGTVEISIAELEAERKAVEAESKPVRPRTVEMSLNDLIDENEQDQPTVSRSPAPGEPIERTEVIPQMSRDLREQLMAEAKTPKQPAPPAPHDSASPRPAQNEESAETMPFQKWQQSQAPTVTEPLPPKPVPVSTPLPTIVDQEEISTVANGQMLPPRPTPPPAPPAIVTPPPPKKKRPSPPASQPPTPPPPESRPATPQPPAPAPVPAQPRSGLSSKTIVIIAVVALLALAALSVAGYASWQLYRRFAGGPATLPSATAPATTETTATATTTNDVVIIEAAPTTTTATAIDTAAVETAAADTAMTTTQAPIGPEVPKTPPKPVKPRVKPPPPPPPTVTVAPEPEPPPVVNEGDLVELGPGVIDAKLITKQPLRLSFKERRLKRTRGTTTIGFIVGIDGTPEQMEILESSGEDAIDKAAIRATAASRYTPATKDGVKVRVRAALEFSNENQ